MMYQIQRLSDNGQPLDLLVFYTDSPTGGEHNSTFHHLLLLHKHAF